MAKVTNRLENTFIECNVRRDNIFENLFTYSIFASHSLDFLASAAGKVDIEAARLIRTAQQMIRTRVDVLFRTALYGEEGFGVKGAFAPFGEIYIATSEDAGQAFKADPNEIINDLENIYKANDYGDMMKVEGPLFEKINRIIKAEDQFYQSDWRTMIKTATEEQEYIMENLRRAAAVILAHLYNAIGLLRDKIMLQEGQISVNLICSSCGMILKGIDTDDNDRPAMCPVCGAPPSMIVEYNLKEISPTLKEMFWKLQHNMS